MIELEVASTCGLEGSMTDRLLMLAGNITDMLPETFLSV